MRVVRHTDGVTFAAVAIPFLVAAEAENNLLLGICAWLASGAPRPRPPYLATIENDAGVPVPGVLGPAPVADALAEGWHRRTGDGVRREREQRIYQLTAVLPPRPVPGALRQATAADLPIVDAWAHAFVADIGLTDDAADIAQNVRHAVREGRLYVWDDGRPVTMATWTGPTPNGVRVTLVYTPPALRGRGYASSCVAALSAMLLASGRRACFLFTDLANPTSNSIYAKIGYRPVCDVHDYRFERGGGQKR